MNTIKIVDDLAQIMVEKGYNAQYIHSFSKFGNDLNRFIHEKFRTDQFDYEYGILFLEQHADLPSHPVIKDLTSRQQEKLRFLKRMAEYQDTGQFLERTIYSTKPEPESLLPLWEQFEKCLEEENVRLSTIEEYRRINQNFLIFLEEKGFKEIRDFNIQYFNDYASTLTHLKKTTLSKNLYIIRRFLVWLYEAGYIDKNYQHLKLPKDKSEKIPCVWKPKEIRKLLSVIDRNTPIGKRDYAVILLAVILGLRRSDIRSLRISDINFHNRTITLITIKNRKRFEQKVPAILLEALEDYLLNARPQIFDFDHVFLKHQAPFTPIENDPIDPKKIAKYLKKAGVEIKGRSTGLHSFRHALASLLVKEGVELPVISEILTHSSVDTTDIYIKTDLEGLLDCVLDIDPEDLWG